MEFINRLFKKKQRVETISSTEVFTNVRLIYSICKYLNLKDVYVFQHTSPRIYSAIHDQGLPKKYNQNCLRSGFPNLKQYFENLLHRPDRISDFRLAVIFPNKPEFNLEFMFCPPDKEKDVKYGLKAVMVGTYSKKLVQ